MVSNHKATRCHSCEFISSKCLLSFFETQALKNCEETSSRGTDRTGIAHPKEVERKKERKKEKESEENRGNQAFQQIVERLLGKGLRALKAPVASPSEGEIS